MTAIFDYQNYKSLIFNMVYIELSLESNYELFYQVEPVETSFDYRIMRYFGKLKYDRNFTF